MLFAEFYFFTTKSVSKSNLVHVHLPMMKCASHLQSTQAKQRKESLQKAVEKAKVGRQDTVRLFCGSRKCIDVKANAVI